MGKDLKGTELGRGIHQRKDGRYEVRIYKNGVSKSFYVKTAAEARTLHKKYSKKQKDVGLCGIDEIYSMLRIEWAGHIQEDSLKNYDYHYRILSQYLTNMPLNEVTPAKVQSVINELQQEYSWSTYRQIVNMLRKIFHRAWENGSVSYDPMQGIKIYSEHKQLFEKKYLEQDEIKIFEQVCQGRRYCDLFLLLLYSGITIKEACLMNWEDIDWKNNFLQIRGSHKRIIPMELKIKELLGHRKKRGDTSKGIIFTSRTGKALTSKYVADELRKVSELLWEKYEWNCDVTSTILRNTFIYQKYMEGVNLFVLARILGITYETCEKKIRNIRECKNLWI